jgi:hypothetical protein
MATRTRGGLHEAFDLGNAIASGVYGTVTAMATVAAYGRSSHPWTLAGVVSATAAVLWIAHVYAHSLSESIALRRPVELSLVLRIARREVTLVLAAVPPVAFLVVGASGLLKERTAVWLALGAGVVTLAVEGALYARLESLRFTRLLAAVATNVALGLIVVLLKVSLAH